MTFKENDALAVVRRNCRDNSPEAEVISVLEIGQSVRLCFCVVAKNNGYENA